MPAEKKASGQDAQPETGPPPWERLRRAQIEWMRSSQGARLDYQQRLAEATAAYHAATRQLVEDNWKNQLAALDAATRVAGEKGAPGQTKGAAEGYGRYLHGLRDATRAAQDAYSRAWFDLQDALQSSNADYVVAVDDVYRSMPQATAGAPRWAAVIGDEGPENPEQLFNPVVQFWNALGRNAGFGWSR